MIFVISLIVYIISFYVGFQYTVKNGTDKEKILNWKDKSIVFIWFIFFISSQMLMISQIMMWVGLA